MKVKEIKIHGYVFRNQLGEYKFDDVKIIVPFDSKITSKSFNQDRDDYSISSQEIERMGKESAQRFLNEKYKGIITEKAKLTPDQIYGIALIMDCNQSEMATILNIDKSTMSRIFTEKLEIQPALASLLMEKLKNEAECPGSTRSLLDSLNSSGNNQKEIREFRIPAVLVAEWFIQKFIELEDPITNLKLQKLLYYAQGIALGRYSCKIFTDLILAWENGPVVESIWKLNAYNKSILSSNVERNLTPVEETENVVKILEETVSVYGKYAAWDLRNKTHQEKPWLETKQNEVISDELMKDFFAGVMG